MSDCLFVFMEKSLQVATEPKLKDNSCPYCTDAPISHGLFYFASLLANLFDNQIIKVTKHAPDFLKNFVDWLLASFFDIALFLGLARLSSDINQSATFRSRVIWEEAKVRGIDMRQVVMFGKPLDQYRARINGKNVYFNSLPIPTKFLNMKKNWDDKFILKQEFSKHDIPTPECVSFPVYYSQNIKKIFSKLKTPVIIKPRLGSRGRHTITNINTLDEFKTGVRIAGQISSYLVAEEHLHGDVCRATLVNGELMGFYRACAPAVVGDGESTIEQLILEKDKNRPDRVEQVLINDELKSHVERAGFTLDEILPVGINLPLTHRTGRLFGGTTREMLSLLHPSFIPFLEKAARVVDLPVVGFDCIVPDPTEDANAQKWGIIECNTLPFIDLHYYALEGKPKNIAGKIWDLWN